MNLPFVRSMTKKKPFFGACRITLRALAADLEVGQDHRLRGREVPVVARRLLVVPDVLAGVGVQRDDGRQVQVVAARRAALVAAPRGCRCRCRRTSGSARGRRSSCPRPCRRRRPPTTCRSGPRSWRPWPSTASSKRLARVARHGEPAPLLLAGRRVVGGDVAAHAVLGAAVADDHLALEDPRRAGDGVATLAVDDRVLLPHLAARWPRRARSGGRRRRRRRPCPGTAPRRG